MSEEKKRRFFYDLAKDSYDDANATLDTLDGKANNFFTIDAALITVVAGLAYFLVQNLSPTERYSPLLLTPIGVSLGMFVISLAIAIRAYSPTARDYVDADVVIRNTLEDSYRRVLARTAVTFTRSASNNTELIKKKAMKLEWTARFMWLGLFFTILGFAFFFYVIK